jgi:hypothetical protein
LSKETYREYLKSSHWKNLKKVAKSKTRNRRCGVCWAFDVPLDFHHISYNKDLSKVSPDQIRTVCRDCHNAIHVAKDTGLIDLSKTKSTNGRWVLMQRGAREVRGLTKEKLAIAKQAYTKEVYIRDSSTPSQHSVLVP